MHELLFCREHRAVQSGRGVHWRPQQPHRTGQDRTGHYSTLHVTQQRSNASKTACLPACLLLSAGLACSASEPPDVVIRYEGKRENGKRKPFRGNGRGGSARGQKQDTKASHEPEQKLAICEEKRGRMFWAMLLMQAAARDVVQGRDHSEFRLEGG